MIGQLGRLALVAIAAAGVASAASLPWPAGDAFEFPGYPVILDGAWYGQAPDAQRPHIVLSKDGQTVSHRRNADSSVTTLAYTVTSYVCLDNSTALFIWRGRTFPSGAEVVSCAAARIDAKKRAYAAYTAAEGKCPDPTDLDTGAGFTVDSKEDIAGQQTYDRVEGVLPGDPVLACANATAAPPVPPATPAPANAPKDAPEALPAFKGAGTATGVQKTAGVLQFTTLDGYFAGLVPDSGQGVFAVTSAYLSHDCVPGTANDYIAATQQTNTYNNGTGWAQGLAGYHCERGERVEAGEATQLQLMFGADTDCAALGSAAFTVDKTLEVFKEIPGFPTDCTSAAGRAGAAAAALVWAATMFLA